MTFKDEDFNAMEINLQLVLYYIIKAYPEWVDRQAITDHTKLHYNTVKTKISLLLENKLIREKKEGRKPYYFVEKDIKTFFDNWTSTEIGKKTLEKFKERLKKP